jgi:hypothetical protein
MESDYPVSVRPDHRGDVRVRIPRAEGVSLMAMSDEFRAFLHRLIDKSGARELHDELDNIDKDEEKAVVDTAADDAEKDVEGGTPDAPQ